MSVFDTLFDIFGGHTIGGTPSIEGNGPPPGPHPTHVDSGVYAGRYAPGADNAQTGGHESPSAYPYTAICVVETTWKDGSFSRGVGTMVGPNDVLTSGSMVWDPQHGGSPASVKVMPGYNEGNAPFGSFQGALFNYFQGSNNGDGIKTHAEGGLDVGIIGLSQNVGAQTGTFGLLQHADPGTITLTGYPDGFGGVYTGPKMMNDFVAVSVDGHDWLFDFSAKTGAAAADIRPGDVGAPLWYEIGDAPYVAGVLSTYTYATDLTGTMNQIKAWIHDNDYLMHA